MDVRGRQALPHRDRQILQAPYSKDTYLDDSKDWFHEGYADQPWVKQLWTKYRPPCPAPTDGWKQNHDDSYYRNAVQKQRKE